MFTMKGGHQMSNDDEHRSPTQSDHVSSFGNETGGGDGLLGCPPAVGESPLSISPLHLAREVLSWRAWHTHALICVECMERARMGGGHCTAGAELRAAWASAAVVVRNGGA